MQFIASNTIIAHFWQAQEPEHFVHCISGLSPEEMANTNDRLSKTVAILKILVMW